MMHVWYGELSLLFSAMLVFSATHAAGGGCGMVVLNNTKCTLGKYGSSWTADVDGCCASCAADRRCAQWTFHADRSPKKPGTTNCDRVATAAAKQSLGGAVCGVKGPTPPPNPAPPTPAPPPTPTPTPTPPLNLNHSWAVLPLWLKLLVKDTTAEKAAACAENFQLCMAASHAGGDEEAQLSVCRHVKAANNGITPCTFYWNTEKMLNSTATTQRVVSAHPGWLLRDDAGQIVYSKAPLFCIDYRQRPAADFYLSACLNATRSGVVDGCSLDSAKNFNEADDAFLTQHFTPWEQQLFVDGKRASLQRLQRLAPGKAMFVHCETCDTAGRTCAGMSAQQIQDFDVTQAYVDVLRLMASEGKAFKLYNDGRNGLSCEDAAQRGALLGTFLVGAGDNAYFNCGPNCNNDKIYPEFRKPLGPPLEDARDAAGTGVLTRRFTHGAVAMFQPGESATARGQACVVWGDGAVSGVCPNATGPQ
jgi:hypothetical protein